MKGVCGGYHISVRLSLLGMLALLAGCLPAAAQTGRVHGHVSDSQSGEALVGAVITAEIRSGTVSDTAGNYSLALPPGEHVLTIRMLGYMAGERRIQLAGGESLRLDILMEADRKSLSVVVISAGKYEQDVSEVTVSMEVLRPELLRDKNIVELNEALQQTPGVSIVDDEPQIRSGSGYSFGAGSRVQVLVDDIPVLSGDAGKPSWGFMPVENVSQVEVIKGASSVLYGSAALSGVVNFRTGYPRAEPETRLSVYHGFYSAPESRDAKTWDHTPMRSGLLFSHSQKFRAVDLVLGASLQGDDGHLGAVSGAGSLAESWDYMRADRLNASNRARVTCNLRRNFSGVPGLSAGINGIYSSGISLATLIWANDSTGLYGAYEGSATRTAQQLSTLDPFVEYRKGMSRQTLRTRWQSLDNRNDNNQGNFSDVLYAEYQYQQHWDSAGVKGLTTTLGAVGIWTDARGELFVGGRPDGRNEAANRAAYLQVDHKPVKKVNLSAGVRYEQFVLNGEEEGRPVFRAGANYQAARATWLRGSFGQGYRFPTIAEKFIITSLGAVRVFANPDLKSETSWNAEVGIKQGFRLGGFRGFADVAAFQQEFRNFIEFTFGQWDPEPSIFNMLGLGFKSLNTGRARVQGIDFSVMGEGEVGRCGFTLLAGYTFTRPVSLTPDEVYARAPADPDNTLLIDQLTAASFQSTSSDPSGNILKYRMQHLIRADVGFTAGRWNAGLSFRSNSHMQNIDNAFEFLEEELTGAFNPGIRRWRREHTRGDYVWDVRAGFRIGERHRLALVINNVLNREYAIRPLAIEEPRVTMIQYTLDIRKE